MSEIARLASLMTQTFEGHPYYGPSVLKTLADVPADVAVRKPPWSAHSIWELVLHLTAELAFARSVIDGTAGPWIAADTTWPPITDRSEVAWQQAVSALTRANRALVRAVQQLDDSVLDTTPTQVRGPYDLMLHGTLQHTIWHAGQISLLTGQRTLPDADGAA